MLRSLHLTVMSLALMLAVFALVYSSYTSRGPQDAEASAEIVEQGLVAAPPAPEFPRARPLGDIESVAQLSGPMPTGVTVSREGRIFVNFPRWGDDVAFTVAELRDGEAVPFPSSEVSGLNRDEPDTTLVSVQSVVVGPANRLWILDTGRIQWGKPLAGGPKLVGVDLNTNRVVKNIALPPDVVLETTYLNDVRLDLRRGEEGMAFITDSSGVEPGLIVVDLATGKSWRRLSNHSSTRPVPRFIPLVEGRPLLSRPANGRPSYVQVGADGIAMGPQGERLFYCPLSGTRLYSVSVEALADPARPDEEVAQTVEDLGDKIVASDGLESDAAGNVYLTAYEHNAIIVRSPQGGFEPLVYDPRVLWPDTLCLAPDGYLYFTANQLHRQPGFHNGDDLREKPYVVFRVKTGARPVMLLPDEHGS